MLLEESTEHRRREFQLRQEQLELMREPNEIQKQLVQSITKFFEGM